MGYGVGYAYGLAKHEKARRQLDGFVKKRYNEQGLEAAQELSDYIFAQVGYRVPVPPND